MKITTLEEALKWIAEKYPEKFKIEQTKWSGDRFYIHTLNSDQLDEICREIGIRIFVMPVANEIFYEIWACQDGEHLMPIKTSGIELPPETTDREAKIDGLIAWVNKQN